jgi:hypothetical protein
VVGPDSGAVLAIALVAAILAIGWCERHGGKGVAP